METNTRKYVIVTEEVSWKFNIGIEKAKEKLGITTQKGPLHVVHPLYHIY